MMRCSSMVEHSAVNRTVAGSSPAAAAILLLISLLSGCIIVYGEETERDYYYPLMHDATWDCYNMGHVDEWEFVVEANFHDVYYILAEVIDLVDGNNVYVSFTDYDTIYGYYYQVEEFSLPQCGTPVDVEFTIYDYDGYWEKYIVYW